MFLQLVISGLSVGSLYALVALGFVIIYKATNVLNIAQGELVMLGAFIGYSLYTFLKLPVYQVMILVPIFMVLFGIFLERLALRPLIMAPHITIIMATLALLVILQSGARLVWGEDVYPFPPLSSPIPVKVGPVLVTPQNFWVTFISLGLMALLILFFQFTRLGKGMRAVHQKPEAASLMGIPVKRVVSLSWGISSALGGVTGVLVAPLLGIAPGMGWIGVKAFAAAILGGFTSLPGAIVGGLSLGVVENLAGVYISSLVKDITAFAVLILVLAVKPTGLFERSERKRV